MEESNMLCRINRKLKSSAGVTVVIGLVAFLIASIASVAIVTISLNNVHRVDDQQKAQRAYLTVTSAATLLREKLAGQEVVIEDKLLPNPLTVSKADRKIMDKDGVVNNVDALAKALAVAMLDEELGSTPSELTLAPGVNDADGKSMNMKIQVSYTGTRVEMRFEPPDAASGDFPVKLIFDGAKAEIGPLQPVYVPYWDGYVLTYELDHYIRTTRVVFDASRIYAQAE